MGGKLKPTLGRKKFFLFYADDVVLVAKKDVVLKFLITVFEEYEREIDLWVNVEKTKLVRFVNKKDVKQNK